MLDPLGSGVNGVAFRARDRFLDDIVTVKLTHGPIAEHGTEWGAASRLRHVGIATVRTIEPFAVGDSVHAAIVSDYVPGRTLRECMQSVVDAGEPAARAIVAVETIRSIAVALQHCHDAGTWHGDLHDRNVVVRSRRFWEDEDGQSFLDAVLIDFGTSSICGFQRGETVGERQRCDVHDLVDLAMEATHGLLWATALQDCLRVATIPRQVHEAIDAVLAIVGRLDGDHPSLLTPARFDRVQRVLAAHGMGGAPWFRRLQELAQDLAARHDLAGEYENAYMRFKHRVETDPSYPGASASVVSRDLEEEHRVLAAIGLPAL